MDRKNSQKQVQKYTLVTKGNLLKVYFIHNVKANELKQKIKDAFAREKSHVSFFGWINIKRVNSKAGLGTLALNGEMNNMQLTVLLGRKMLGFY